MYGFIARQPIFNPEMNTVAYELLFRDGMTKSFSGCVGRICHVQDDIRSVLMCAVPAHCRGTYVVY